MRKTCFFCAVIMLLLNVIACQKNPDSPSVINHNPDTFLNSNADNLSSITNITSNTDIAIDWSEKYMPYDNTIFNIDLSYAHNGTLTFPVYKLKNIDFTNNIAQTIVNAIIENPTGIRLDTRTKEDIANDLFDAHRGRLDFDSNGQPIFVPYPGQEDDIRNLEKELALAPDEVFDDLSTFITEFPVNCVFITSDNTRWWLDASKRQISLNTHNSIIQQESWIVKGNARPGEPSGTTLNHVLLSNTEAIQFAENLIDDLGILNMGLAHCEKARIINDHSEVISEGWQLIYARNDGGRFPIDYAEYLGSFLAYDNNEYVAPLQYERIVFFVDESGIQHFDWTNPSEIIEISHSNIKTITAKELKDRILAAFKIGIAWFGENQPNEIYSCSVVDLKLTNCIYPVKDSKNQEFYFIPVWTVKLIQDINGFKQDGILCISAGDGAFINPSFAAQ